MNRTYLEFLKQEGIDVVMKAKKPTEGRPQIRDVAAKGEDLNAEMAKLKEKADRCKLCPELARTRNKVVFGSGNIKADLVFVGEAPGAEEDKQGLPFVGRAGQLLTKMIEAMGLSRNDVFICNTLKCRPPGNRNPKPEEKRNCNSFLTGQLALIKPRLIVALGTHAAQSLLDTETPISKLRGSTHAYEGIDLICTFHPAYLLRNPGAKKDAWADLKKVMEMLGLKK